MRHSPNQTRLLSSISHKMLFSFVALSIAAQSSAVFASSHREAPNIAGSPRVDGTDFYMFRSYEPGRSDYTTLIANYSPLEDAYGGPNYFALDPNAIYEIHIDNNGDGVEDLTYQFKFQQSLAGGSGIALNVGQQSVAVPLKNVGPVAGKSSNLNFLENYTLTVIQGDRRSGKHTTVTNSADGSTSFTKPYDYVGDKTFGSSAGYTAYANQYIYNVTLPSCSQPAKLFVGQRKEGFSVNLGKIFDLVNLVPIEGDSAPGANDNGGFPGGIKQSPANNILSDKNITSLALEVPTACLTGGGNGVIGGWTTASLPQATLLNPKANFASPKVVGGAYTQVSRLGIPLVNELVIGLKDKDHFNASKPKDDAQFATYVTNPTLPALLNVLFKDAVNTTLGAKIADLAPTNFPRKDLVAAFLTGLQGLNQQATVTASEMLRLNTKIAPTDIAVQKPLGVLADDLAGFPNGRRPGDDVVDAELRVAMGALCHPVTLSGATTNLGLCNPGDAAVGKVAFTDGAPIKASDFQITFPYLTTPISGSR